MLVSERDKRISQASMPRVEDVLSSAAIRVRRDLPKTLDDITQWTAIKAQGRTLSFYYLITKPELFSRIKFELVKPDVIKSICSNVADVNVLNRGATYAYYYTDGIIQPELKFLIVASNCKCLRKDAFGDCLEADPIKPSVEDVLSAAAISWQQKLPLTLDDITQLQRVKAHGKVLAFYHVIAKPGAFPTIDFKIVKTMGLKTECENVANVNILNRGAQFANYYTDGIAQPKLQFYVVASDCTCLKKDAFGDCLKAEPSQTARQ